VLPTLRVGLALGEVLSRDGDYYGPVVNLAARAAKLAKSDDIVVSSEIRATVERDQPGMYRFEDLGSLTVGCFEVPLHLHALTRPQSGS